MAIVCKGERVDEGVVVCDRQHDSYARDSYNSTRKMTPDRAEAESWRYHGNGEYVNEIGVKQR